MNYTAEAKATANSATIAIADYGEADGPQRGRPATHLQEQPHD